MPVSKLSEHNESEQLLDIKNFGSKSNQIKVAICERILMKRDQYKALYISYVFRDVTGRRIPGRQFGVTEVKDLLEKSYQFIGQAVILTASLSVFHGVYLDITSMFPMSKEDSDKLRDRFFTQQIPNYDEEISINAQLLATFATKRYAEIYKQFNVNRKITDGFDPDISQGFKSSPILLINNFCTTLSTFATTQTSKDIVLAYMLVQAIDSVASGDPVVMIKQLVCLEDIICLNMDVQSKRIYEITEDILYLMYGMQKDVFTEKSLIAFKVHTSVYSLLKLQSSLEDKVGVYEHESQLYRKD